MQHSDGRSVHKPLSGLNDTTNTVSGASVNAQDPSRPIGTRCTRGACRFPKGSEAHCSVCHQTMSGVSYFDDHRRDGRCVPLTDLGLVEQDGLWTTPEGHASRAASAERLAALRAVGSA